MNKTTRRKVVFGGISAAAAAALATPARAERPVFYRNPGCGCCHGWTQRMAEAGLEVDLRDTDDLAAMSDQLGIPPQLAGCHVGRIGGYVISGHVPPDDIMRLLAEKPAGLALLVPGMPAGSPGMETDGAADRFDVLLLGEGGSTQVFASHG